MPDQIVPASQFFTSSAVPGSLGYTGYAGGSKETGDAERMRYLKAEQSNPTFDQATRDAVGREIARESKPADKIVTTDDFFKGPAKIVPVKPGPTEQFFQKTASKGLEDLKEVGTLGDMFLNLSTNIPAVIGMMNRYGQGIATGESHKVTSEAARQVFDRINSHAPNILQGLLAKIPNPDPDQPAGNETHVTKAMDAFTELTDQEARELSYSTSPVMNENDWKNLRDVAMIALGTKGLEATGEGFTHAFTKPKEENAAAPTQPKEPTLESVAPSEERVARPASTKQLKALQAQVRQKYINDADYAKAFSERARNRALVQNGLNGLEKAITDRAAKPKVETTPTILTPEGRVDTSVVGQRSLDTGLRKLTSKQPFLLTPEEKIAILGNAKSWGGLIEKGAADPDLLAAMAIGGVGTALALAYPDKAKEAFDNLGLVGGLFVAGSLQDLATHSDAAPFSALKETNPYNLKTFDRLPQNASVLRKSLIEETLRRPDVGKAEKELVQSILKASPGDTITPKALLKGFKEATGGFELKKVATNEYADYEKDAIGRVDPTIKKTHVWLLPEHIQLSDTNHFNEPRYFGHTRVFVEDGVRHIQEIQSDLTQHLGKALSREEMQKALEEYPTPQVTKAINDTAIHSQIEPIIKDSYKRLIREELADAARSGESIVRFATGDTASKVEMWARPIEMAEKRIADNKALLKDNPYLSNREKQNLQELIVNDQSIIDLAKSEGRQFSPAHQTIYNRYKGPQATFLRGLGGKDITDSLGHSWIEVPTTSLGKRVQMLGRSKPEVLMGIAVAGLGMAVGAKLDPSNPIEGAVLGVLGAALVKGGIVPAMREAASKIVKPDARIRINDLTERLAYHKAAGVRIAWQASSQLIHLVPKEADQIALTRSIDEGRTGELTGKMAEAAAHQRLVMEEALKIGREHRVLEDAVEDYITHFWQLNGNPEEAAKQFAKSMRPETRFAKARNFATLAEGRAAGFTPLTENAATITDMYLNSVYNAIANKRFLDDLHHLKTGDLPLVIKAAKAPKGYVYIDHALLRNYGVHPDIAPSLKFLFDQQAPGKVMAALSAVNTAIKRNAVSLSLFHAKSLVDAAIGAFKNPITAVKVLAQTTAPKVLGENRFLRMAREGGAGDLVDAAQRDGVVFSFERAAPAVEDVTGSFYKGMNWLQKELDRMIPGASLPIKLISSLNHHLDNFMWGRLHAAFKLEIYAAKKEALIRNTAKVGKGLSDEQAGRIAASYANDIFGGLNWQRIAEDANTKWGRDLALEALSPKGRRLTQLFFFAPDWTLSTTRALVQARPRSLHMIEGAKGLLSSKTLGDLHRQQLLRSALWYATVGDGINYAATGHHLWDNKNPFRVELGDGLSMQLSKHFAEPFEWVERPGQQFLNKLGYLPSEALDQAEGSQYLSSSGHAPRMDTSLAGRVQHAARAFVPFAASQFMGSQGSPRAALSSALGVPIYGQTPAERRKARLDAALKKYHDQYGGQ